MFALTFVIVKFLFLFFMTMEKNDLVQGLEICSGSGAPATAVAHGLHPCVGEAACGLLGVFVVRPTKDLPST